MNRQSKQLTMQLEKKNDESHGLAKSVFSFWIEQGHTGVPRARLNQKQNEGKFNGEDSFCR